MPYLQICLEHNLQEHEAQRLLTYMCEHFPLQRSAGRLYRIAADFVLFEQPEHDVLTLEQEIWLEKHKKESHIRNAHFYKDKSQACRACRHPFEDSPTGYCPTCSTINPFQWTILKIPLTQAEDEYLARRRGQGMGGPSQFMLTFLDMLAGGQLTMETVLQTEATRFTEQANRLFQEPEICHICGLIDEQCTCAHSPFRYKHINLTSFFSPEHFIWLYLSHQHARRLQELADQYELTVDVLMRMVLETPAIQIVTTSREVASGTVSSIEAGITRLQRDSGK